MTDDLERRLREALRREAEQVNPNERRTEILAMTHDDTQQVEPERRWLMPVGAAASVALIGAVIWGVSTTGGDEQLAIPAATQVTRSSTEPEPAQAAAPTAEPSAKVAVPQPAPTATRRQERQVDVATTKAALPAYFVGANSPAGGRFGLYREFVRTTVPVGATPAQKARAAVAVAMSTQPFTGSAHYLQPWAGTSVNRLTVTPNRITITLSGPGASGFTPAQTRLAVQELVWTAQAAVGKGTVPVKFVVAGGATKLFGTYSTARTYNRPAKDLQYQDLAPIWISSPLRGQVLPAGAPVVTTGESCAFEATTQWQLKKNGKAVKSGFTTASSGCPTRGTWKVKLGVLPAGGYTFRMYEPSMENGQDLVAETSRSFTVR